MQLCKSREMWGSIVRISLLIFLVFASDYAHALNKVKVNATGGSLVNPSTFQPRGTIYLRMNYFDPSVAGDVMFNPYEVGPGYGDTTLFPQYNIFNNLYGANISTYDDTVVGDALQKLKDKGYNTVRIYLSNFLHSQAEFAFYSLNNHGTDYTTDGKLNKEAIKNIAKFAKNAGDKGIYVILALGLTPDTYANSDTVTEDVNIEGYNNYFMNLSMIDAQGRYIADLLRNLYAYKNNYNTTDGQPFTHSILGLELINEPFFTVGGYDEYQTYWNDYLKPWTTDINRRVSNYTNYTWTDPDEVTHTYDLTTDQSGANIGRQALADECTKWWIKRIMQIVRDDSSTKVPEMSDDNERILISASLYPPYVDSLNGNDPYVDGLGNKHFYRGVDPILYWAKQPFRLDCLNTSTDIDFLSLNVYSRTYKDKYPGFTTRYLNSFNFQNVIETYEMTKTGSTVNVFTTACTKPVILSEMNADQNYYTNIDRVITVDSVLQKKSTDYNFDGWLTFAWGINPLNDHLLEVAAPDSSVLTGMAPQMRMSAGDPVYGPILSTNKPVTTSSNQATQKNITDGTTGTYWSPSSDSSPSIIIDLGDLYPVGFINIYLSNVVYYSGSLGVAFSTDGSTFDMVPPLTITKPIVYSGINCVTITMNKNANNEGNQFDCARYVKLQFDNYLTGKNVCEVNVYGPSSLSTNASDFGDRITSPYPNRTPVSVSINNGTFTSTHPLLDNILDTVWSAANPNQTQTFEFNMTDQHPVKYVEINWNDIGFTNSASQLNYTISTRNSQSVYTTRVTGKARKFSRTLDRIQLDGENDTTDRIKVEISNNATANLCKVAEVSIYDSNYYNSNNNNFDIYDQILTPYSDPYNPYLDHDQIYNTSYKVNMWASSYENNDANNSPYKAMDNKPYTYWKAHWYDNMMSGTYPAPWIKVDLGKIYPIDAIKLDWAGSLYNGIPYMCEVDLSLDDTNYSTICYGGNAASQRLTLTRERLARYVRILCNNYWQAGDPALTSANYVQLKEFSIFAPGLAAQSMADSNTVLQPVSPNAKIQFQACEGVDSSINTGGWQSDPNDVNQADKWWYQVDLGRPCHVNAIKINWSYPPQSYRVKLLKYDSNNVLQEEDAYANLGSPTGTQYHRYFCLDSTGWTRSNITDSLFTTAGQNILESFIQFSQIRRDVSYHGVKVYFQNKQTGLDRFGIKEINVYGQEYDSNGNAYTYSN